jgi:hypothetical protein
MVMLPEQVSTSAIKYSDAKVLSNGGKSVYVNHDSKILVIQTPKMVCPYGLSRYPLEEEVGKETKFTLKLSFRNRESDPAIAQLFTLLKEFDQKLVEDASKNSLSWFKKKSMNVDTLKELYTPLIEMFKDKETLEESDKFPPTFKVKIPFRDGVPDCKIYNAKKEEMVNCNLEEVLAKGCKVQVLMQCMGLWFAGGKFGCSWKAKQIRVVETPATIKDYAFISDGQDEDDEDEDEVSADDAAMAAVVAATQATTIKDSKGSSSSSTTTTTKSKGGGSVAKASEAEAEAELDDIVDSDTEP